MSRERTMQARECVVRTTCVVVSSFRRESCGVRNVRFKLLGGEMPQNIRDVMTSNPCTIDAEKSVAYAAKMMREEDVGLAPIVEGDKLIGMLTDRDIAIRVVAEERDPGQVKVRDVASKQVVTIDPQQDLDEALRIMAMHQVRRLAVVEEDGRLVGVVAQADVARKGDDKKTGKLVEEISE